MHPLDNVVWTALSTRQSRLAQSAPGARKFPREITTLAGLEQADSEAYAALAGLLEDGETVGLFLDSPPAPSPGLELVVSSRLLQMVAEDGDQAGEPSPGGNPETMALGDDDQEDMLKLARLTKPGPFGTRTRELGLYLGIRDRGELAAMAGERMRLPGYTEVSAVCTHPAHCGRGYATILVRSVMQAIRERGERPILHVLADNRRAVELYERLGFRVRTTLTLAVVRKPAG